MRNSLCRIWTRLKDQPANPYWVKMTYSPRDYASCLKIKEAYEREFLDREYVITVDSDLMRPPTHGPLPLSEMLAWS